jgi:hypothetical protein
VKANVLAKILAANRSLSHANRVSGRSFPRSGETVFGCQRQKAPNCLLSGPPSLQRLLAGPRLAKRGIFVKPGEISISVGVRGGACSLVATGLDGQMLTPDMISSSMIVNVIGTPRAGPHHVGSRREDIEISRPIRSPACPSRLSLSAW